MDRMHCIRHYTDILFKHNSHSNNKKWLVTGSWRLIVGRHIKERQDAFKAFKGFFFTCLPMVLQPNLQNHKPPRHFPQHAPVWTRQGNTQETVSKKIRCPTPATPAVWQNRWQSMTLIVSDLVAGQPWDTSKSMLYQGSIKALSRLYLGSIKVLSRIYPQFLMDLSRQGVLRQWQNRSRIPRLR